MRIFLFTMILLLTLSFDASAKCVRDVASEQEIFVLISKIAPFVQIEKRDMYAKIISFESKWYCVDPVVIIAHATGESGWNPIKKSRTNDFGLTQIHVSQKGSARFLGRELELYNPAVNLREHARQVAMWENFHIKWCSKGRHSYWRHLKWGRKVPDEEKIAKVTKIIRTLRTMLAHVRYRNTVLSSN